jgi:hypothetical protein
MAEQTFKSPGFFEKEVDLSVREQQATGTPGCVIGAASSGPAFVPVTVGSMTEFVNNFGELDPNNFAPYAVNEFLKNKEALTFIRVLGAGANKTASQISTTSGQGTVANAGFIIKSARADAHGARATSYHAGSVQFLAGVHSINNSHEIQAYPIFTDNDSFNLDTGRANIVRGMIFLASGTRLQIMNHNELYGDASGLLTTANPSTGAKISSYSGKRTEGTFKLVISSSAGTSFSNTDNYAGIKVLTASLNQESDHYIGKILNKDPKNFQKEEHLLYGEFPVPQGIAKIKYDAINDTVAVLSGSSTFRDTYGRFDTRYSNAKTTNFISQPFGGSEIDLFHFETFVDGDASNRLVKVSIGNLRRSSDPLYPYGTFNVIVRDYNDTDLNPRIIEQFNNCSLDPDSNSYVGKMIGDQKFQYNFDALTDDERRLNRLGKYPNNSRYIRIVLTANVESGDIPKETLPFGFRGLPCLNTNGLIKDHIPAGTSAGNIRLAGNSDLTGSIVPPIPHTIKVTRGATSESGFLGNPGASETADSRIYWGIKTTDLPLTSSLSNAALQTNAGAHNTLIDNYTKLLGIQGLNTLTTGSGADLFNNNKFSLAKVGFSNTGTVAASITGSADDHMKEAFYVRNAYSTDKFNASVATSDTRLWDGSLNNRITFSTLVSYNDTTTPNASAKFFNRFSAYTKFTNVFYGGFDGINILDKDAIKFNDKATSTESGGKADGSSNGYLGLDSGASPGGGNDNNLVASYKAAIKVATDPMDSTMNILAIPGIRDANITNYAADKVKEYGQAIYIMDLENYDDSGVRMFDDNFNCPSIQQTSENFDSRALDNNFVATYFPNITIRDNRSNQLVRVPASVAALGAIAFSDSVSHPWFAPAGFTRGSIDFVENGHVRLNASDRDKLYEARINPITSFPNSGYVIFGQKTLQFAKSSLDRVNVRRMLIEVKRQVANVANTLLFEQNTQATRNRFISQVVPLLATIQSQQGIDSFNVVMDSSNNTPEDVQQNRLNGRIILVPTRAVEFIAVDFIITNSGVSFE